MKNINTEITKYHKYILDVYERIKKENRTVFSDNTDFDYESDKAAVLEQVLDQNYDQYDEENEIPTTTLPPTTKASYSNVSDYFDEVHSVKKRDAEFEHKYNDLMNSHIWKQFKGKDIKKMLPDDLDVRKYTALSSFDKCNFSLGLDKNLEYYFSTVGSANKQVDDIYNQEFLSKLDLKNLANLNLKTDSNNLLNLDNLNSLCKWDHQMLNMLKQGGLNNEICYLSLPQIIALLSNKTSCFDINTKDVQNFIQTSLMCYPIHKSGVLYGFSEEHKQKSEIISLLSKNNPINEFMNLDIIRNNLCVHKNLFHIIFDHLIDKDYLSTNSLNIKISSLVISNHGKIFNENFLFNFYMKEFHSVKFDDSRTKLIGLNLAGIRQEAAMRILSSEMSLVALAITLIVIVTLLYLRSIFISMIVNLGVAMSVGVAFFTYRIVFDIELFPFINMMAAFLLIGIACDDVYVLFDAWYNEKARIIMEDLPEQIEKQYTQTDPISDPNSIPRLLPPIFIKNKFLKPSNNPFTEPNVNPLKSSILYNELAEKGININEYTLNPCYVRVAPLTDDQMIRVMGGTLHHAASSIFVTSFTTSAAFLTNFITKLPYVQLFGFFTGTCILVYFLMVITMVAAFVVTYEKFIQPYQCKITTKFTLKLEKWFEKVMESLALLNHRIIAEKLPNLLIKFRVFWFLLFLCFGIAGMIIVFYEPKLKPPSNWRYQFFKTGNQFENFEFSIKDEFWSYVNEEKRNLTNPEIFFIFGIIDKDNGRVFNPDDDGHLVYDKTFDFLDKKSQVWLNEFINVSLAQRRDLFLVDEIVDEWRKYLFQMQQFCWETMNIPVEMIHTNIYLPYERDGLSKCQAEINSFLVNSTIDNFENLMSSFPRRIIFMSNGSDVNAIMLRVNANRTFSDYDAVRDYYHDIKKFHADKFNQAPDGLHSGWFISVAFALYDLQYQLITGTYSSLVTSMLIALVILLMTSGNVLISVFAIITISFSIADTIAIFVLLGWDLSILESVVIIMSVGLSVDFACHYGVAYINSDREFDYDNSLCCNENNNEADQETEMKSAKKKCKFLTNLVKNYKRNNKERFVRINDIFGRVGSAVLMAAFTTFLAGSSMYPSGLTSFGKMGQFLMLVMCTSYLYSTFFFVPMCALFGPTQNYGNLRFKEWTMYLVSKCCKRRKENVLVLVEEQVQLSGKSPNGLNNNCGNHTSNL